MRVLKRKLHLVLVDIEECGQLFKPLVLFLGASFGDPSQQNTIVVHHMVEGYEFEYLSNCENHKVKCHNRVRIEHLNQNNRVRKLRKHRPCDEKHDLWKITQERSQLTSWFGHPFAASFSMPQLISGKTKRPTIAKIVVLFCTLNIESSFQT